MVRRATPQPSSGPSPARLAEILLWVTPAIWSSNYIIARAAAGVVPPNTLAFGRWLIALLLMVPLVWRARAALLVHGRREWKQLFAFGALGTWICGSFPYIAGQTTSATNIALIYAAAPVGITLVGSRLSGQGQSLRQRAGMVLAVLGLLFIISKGSLEVLLGIRFVAGDLWIVAATAAWIAFTLLQQWCKSSLTPVQRLFGSTAAGLLILLPMTGYEVATAPAHWFTLQAFMLMLVAGMVPGLMAYLAYTFMVAQLGATRTALLLYLCPIYAALAAWGILGEAPQWFHGVGAALVLPAIYLSLARRAISRTS
ncbi:DMT family transporter [Herbaspirillum sp. YR522]|uniref:DMT family transporter n=1 Tax=Herbaspirillum sp. YR522 TaxID=1144342 RepID=UPI00026FA2A7|nr:DMT family transporter [Herbaspirillum sp. YR522]EJN06396.1 DMT(drug/metabolite transporter) superfamily permease [Herbaspirillum sp. YR522]